jgi:hypothetical protein
MTDWRPTDAYFSRAAPGTDDAFISGESGAIGTGFIYELMSNQCHKELKNA